MASRVSSVSGGWNEQARAAPRSLRRATGAGRRPRDARANRHRPRHHSGGRGGGRDRKDHAAHPAHPGRAAIRQGEARPDGGGDLHRGRRGRDEAPAESRDRGRPPGRIRAGARAPAPDRCTPPARGGPDRDHPLLLRRSLARAAGRGRGRSAVRGGAGRRFRPAPRPRGRTRARPLPGARSRPSRSRGTRGARGRRGGAAWRACRRRIR